MGRDKETRRSWDDTEVGRLTHRTGSGRAVVGEEVTDSREDGKEEEIEAAAAAAFTAAVARAAAAAASLDTPK